MKRDLDNQALKTDNKQPDRRAGNDNRNI